MSDPTDSRPLCECGARKVWSNEVGYECPYCSKGYKRTDEPCPLCQSPLALDVNAHEYFCETGGCPYCGIREYTHRAIATLRAQLAESQAREAKFRGLLEQILALDPSNILAVIAIRKDIRRHLKSVVAENATAEGGLNEPA